MLSHSVKRLFGFSGPYNPLRFKDQLVPRKFPEDKEIEEHLVSTFSMPSNPVRNVRHVNPIRQSGPLPPYDGPFTMEDIRKTFFNSSIGRDFHYCYTEPEEIMRRVPGITRREAEHIIKLGLNPDEQVDFAYLVYNNGLDIFYKPNSVYIARQVLTNSKGEKTEVYWNAQAAEDMAHLPVGNAPVSEFADYTWEIFLWGETAIHPIPDFDLSVPNTWFEYEEETWQTFAMIDDQFTLPEDLRRQSEKHSNASRELWRSQEDLERIEKMKDPDWVPETKYNVYQKEDFKQ